MSYQKLDQVTFPFAYPITRFDDAVQDIVTKSKYFIAVDMDSGYCQIVSEEEARKILALFTPGGNLRWKVIPMESLNAAPKFVAMMTKLKMG